jgi:ABC-type antimicrobial peptide transport system permease subunit
MNLSTAQSSKYAKEVGIRKVVGARRSSLILRFLSESTLIATIAGMCALIIVSICLPFFNAIVGENLKMNLGNGVFWIAWAIFVLITGVLAGSYPSFYLSSFLPLKVLKGTFKVGNELLTPRKALIVTQFTFAIILITSTLVIHRQINYVKSRNIGYDKERLVSFMITERSRPYRELIRRELLETGVAESVSINFASMIESESRFMDNLRWRGKDPLSQIVIERNYAESGWAKTTGVQIIQGRDIDIHTYPSDSTAMLLNETAVKVMGFDDPIGEIIYEWDQAYSVVGVVKDFVLESPFDPIRPMAIGGPAKGWFNNINVKLSAHGSLAEKLRQMEEIYKKYAFGDPLLYHIVDEVYARHFDKEQRMSSLVSWFAALAIFISCLGLFALVAYMSETRRKEIGIRKVLGASVGDIVFLLSKEFLILIIISFVIASPIAWWAMNKWLEGYAYRTDIPWWLFVAVGCISLCIALLSVGFQAVKAATANPVNAIKSE